MKEIIEFIKMETGIYNVFDMDKNLMGSIERRKFNCYNNWVFIPKDGIFLSIQMLDKIKFFLYDPMRNIKDKID